VLEQGELLLKSIVGLLLSILLISWVLKRFHQPYFSAYIFSWNFICWCVPISDREFSLVLCVIAKDLSLVDDFSYQLTLAVISITMLLSSGWITIIRAFLFGRSKKN